MQALCSAKKTNLKCHMYVYLGKIQCSQRCYATAYSALHPKTYILNDPFLEPEARNELRIERKPNFGQNQETQ